MSSDDTQEAHFQKLEEAIQDLKQKQTAAEQPRAFEELHRLDWKWFLSVSLPLIVPLFTAGVIGYFGLKTNLGILQSNMNHVQSDITEIKTGLKETNKRISAVETRMQAFEVRLVKVEGNVERINEKLDALKKP
jgi:hypothetical protein